jgi:hypothetical protein
MTGSKTGRAPMPLELFEWAVARQSALGPGIGACAAAFGCTAREVRDAVSAWDDPRGHLAVERVPAALSGAPGFRIEAYYNTSGG